MPPESIMEKMKNRCGVNPLVPSSCISQSYCNSAEIFMNSSLQESLIQHWKHHLPNNRISLIYSVRNGLGARAAPRGNCQEDWTGPDDNFYSVPSWDILGLQGLSKDHGLYKVRYDYAVLIKGPQGMVVDCRSPDKDGGDL